MAINTDIEGHVIFRMDKTNTNNKCQWLFWIHIDLVKL